MQHVKIEFLLVGPPFVSICTALVTRSLWNVISCTYFILHLACIVYVHSFAVGTSYITCLWIVCGGDLILFFFSLLSHLYLVCKYRHNVFYLFFFVLRILILLALNVALFMTVHVTYFPRKNKDVVYGWIFICKGLRLEKSICKGSGEPVLEVWGENCV